MQSIISTGGSNAGRAVARSVPANDSHKLAFTIKEAARATGLSRSLLYVAISQGALHARKCGARTLILETDLRRFLRSLPVLAKGDTVPLAESPPRRGRPRKQVAVFSARDASSTP
jgi:excisionase family DNA binding protein